MENLEDELRKNSEELLKRTNSGILTLEVIFPLCVSSTVARFFINIKTASLAGHVMDYTVSKSTAILDTKKKKKKFALVDHVINFR